MSLCIASFSVPSAECFPTFLSYFAEDKGPAAQVTRYQVRKFSACARDAKNLGLTVLRTWAFADGPQWNAIQPALGILDERVLTQVAPFLPVLLVV